MRRARDNRPSYAECLARGMTVTETARARGISPSSVSHWARYHGVRFIRDDAGVAARRAARMRAMFADPEVRRAWSARARAWHADPRNNPLVALSALERADYDTLKRAGYSRAEALRAIDREDLCGGAGSDGGAG